MLRVFPFLFQRLVPRRGAGSATSSKGGKAQESTPTVTPAAVPLSPGEELKRKKKS